MKNTSMGSRSRIALTVAFCCGAILPVTSAFALDDVKTPSSDPAALRMFKDPRQAMSKFLEGYQSGAPVSSIEALRYAADGGEPLARWKLGAMYASGDGVQRDDAKAYDYFLKIVQAYDESEPSPRERSIFASAFVAVGAYALNGIPASRVARDPERALRMFTIAATEFRDPNAQYNLGRMYLDGDGPRKDARRGAQWLRLAADKNHTEAQALLGQIYFDGAEGVQRQRAMGLMYLTMARENAGERKTQQWIVEAYDRAMATANSADRQGALAYLRDHLDGRRP
jgi:TPR repeat protein